MKKRFIPKGNKNRPNLPMEPEYITVHETANRSIGANAEMHSRYLENGAGGRAVSWHYTVDDAEIIQHLPTNEVGWHAGDGYNGKGNRNSIGIEICVNRDGNFDVAVQNAQSLIRQLMDEHGIKLKNVVPHKHWSGKDCPHNLLDRWDEFKAELKEERLFEDVPNNHWAISSIKKAKKSDVLNGYSDGTFKPDKPLTRAEFSVVLDRAGILDNLLKEDK